MNGMINREANTNWQDMVAGFPGDLRPIGEAMNAISAAKQEAHDYGLVDTPSGKFLTDAQIYSVVAKNSCFFVGQTPEGSKTVFGIVAEARSRTGREIPVKTLQAVNYARQMRYLQAIANAEYAGQISQNEAYQTSLDALGGSRYVSEQDRQELAEFDGFNPTKAADILANRRFSEKLFQQRNQDTTGPDKEIKPLTAREKRTIGLAAAVPQLAAAYEAEKRGTKKSLVVRNVLIGTAIATIVLSACAPVQATKTPESGTATGPRVTETTEVSRYTSQLIDISAAVAAIKAGQAVQPSATTVPEVAGTADPRQQLVDLHEIWQDQARGIPGMENVAEPQIQSFLVTDKLGPDESVLLTENPDTQQVYIINRYAGDTVSEKIDVRAPYYSRITMGEKGDYTELHTYYRAGGQEVALIDWTDQGFEFIGVDGRRMPLTEIIMRLGEENTGGGKLLSPVPSGAEFYAGLPAGSVIDMEAGTITDSNGERLWVIDQGKWVESLLPQEVKEKLELAGVDIAQMQNAKYDKDGLHITLENGEVIVLTNTDLQKGVYLGQDNVLQYRGVFHDSVVYTFDKETGKWVKISMIELDLVDGSKLEMIAFSDKQEVMDFVASDAMWFEGNRMASYTNYPELRGIVKEMIKIGNSVLGVILQNGNGLFPPYPDKENPKFFILFIYDVGDNGIIFVYPDKNGNPATVFFDDPDLKNDRSSLTPFIVNTWKYNDGN